MSTYGNQSIYPQNIRFLDAQTFLPADTTTIKLLSTAGTLGSWIRWINASTTETGTAHDMAIYLQISSTNYLVGTVGIPVNSGLTSAVAPVDVLRSLTLAAMPSDSCGNKVFWLPPNASIYVGMNVTVSANKVVTVTAGGEDF